MARPVHAPSSSIRALVWAPCGALFIALQAGCGGEAAPPRGTPTVVADGAVDTLVTTASGVLGWARGLAVGDDGILYVSDARTT